MKLASLAAIAIVLGAGPARAAPATDYERHYRRGTELSEHQDWARARAEFEAAYQIEPRAILLFNIASTYFHEDNRIDARVYYQWYLDKGGDDPKLIAIARERLAELDKPAMQVAPPPPVPARQAYPRVVIERPQLLPAGMIAAATGLAVGPVGQVASISHGDGMGYAYRAVLTGTFGVVSRVNVAGELDVDLARARASLAFAQAMIGVSDGAIDLAVRGTIGFAFERTGLYDLRLAIPARIRITDQLALVSSEDSLLVTLDDPHHEVFVRIPIGIAYQLAPVYLTLETRLAMLELREPSARVLLGDYRRISLGATVVPAQAVDVVVRLTASSEGNAATAMVRLRM